jgi:hypothetical protein
VQEYSVLTQCLERLKPFAITATEAAEIRQAIESRMSKDSASLVTEVKAIEEKMSVLQQKLDRLTHAYIDGVIDEDSYRRANEDLIVQRTTLKKEKERLQRTRASYWNEPTKELINTLEIAGNPNLSESLPDVSRLVQKIGTNRHISRKTVSFSISELYQKIPETLGLCRYEAVTSAPSFSNQNHRSQVWCAREDLNLQSFRNQILSLARLPFRHARVGKEDGSRRPQPQERRDPEICSSCPIFSRLSPSFCLCPSVLFQPWLR